MIRLIWYRLFIVILVFVGFGAGGCGGFEQEIDGNRGNGVSPDEEIDYAIKHEDVLEEGCLSFQRVIERLRAFPMSTKMRRVTTDFKVYSGGIRRNFELMLTFGTFEFEETQLDSFTLEFNDVIQHGCDEVVFMIRNGEGDRFEMKSASESEIEFRHSSDGRWFAVSFEGGQSLDITRGYTATDYQCSREAPARVSYTQTVRWGGLDVGEVPTESISTTYLQSIMRVTNEEGAETINRVINDAHGARVAVATKDLRKLTKVKADSRYRSCW